MCGCVEKIAHGAAGLAKAFLGIDRADDDTIEWRRTICRKCEHAEPCIANVVKFCKCKKCGCVLRAKTASESESCPEAKW